MNCQYSKNKYQMNFYAIFNTYFVLKYFFKQEPMDQQKIILKTKSFNLLLELDQIAVQYPDLAESWLQMKQNKGFQLKNSMEKQIQAKLIFLYRQNCEQALGYKIIKHQRLLKMLAKLSKRLPFFQRVEQVLIIQDNQLNKKGTSKYSNMDAKQQLKQFYMQKTQTILEKIIKQHSSILALLKLIPCKNFSFTLKEFISWVSQSIRGRYHQQIQVQQQLLLNEDFKGEVIRVVACIQQKVSIVLKEVFTVLVKEGETDVMMGSYLTGRNKFFKIEGLDYGNYHNQKGTKFWQKWGEELNDAMKVLFEIRLETDIVQGKTIKDTLSQAKVQGKSQRDFFSLSKVQELELRLGWNWSDIQKTVTYLQSLYTHLTGKASPFQLKPTTSQPLAQRIATIISKMSRLISKQLFFTLYQSLSDLIKIEDWIDIQITLGIDTNQVLLHHKQKEGNFGVIGIEQEIFENDEEETHEFRELELGLTYQYDPSIQLNKSLSRTFLYQFYHHQLATIYSFIQCQKRWFFYNNKPKDLRLQQRYNTSLTWIPLNKNIMVQNFAQLSTSDTSTFSAYVGSMVYSFFELKQTPKLKSLLKDKTQKSIMIESQNNENTDFNRYHQFFLYNDVENILAYQNLSFENIAHCHYYLKNIKNDSRAEFDDRSWTEYLKNQTIRLFVKDKNPTKQSSSNNKLSQLHTIKKHFIIHQGINLIRIPVRGRYCQHLDFFDLSEVYQSIFPQPFCSPQQISCPKCYVQIPFEELIYLKQVEIILQMIKQFYIQEDGISKFMSETISDPKVISDNLPQKQVHLQHKMVFVLQDLRLVMSHPTQSVKLKGKYLLKNLKNHYQNTQSQIQEQPITTGFQEMQFQQNLNQQIYQTLLNPNKKFGSTKKLKKFLKNFSRPNSKQYEWIQTNQHIIEQKESPLNFDQKIQYAKTALHNRQKLYKDLEKGTISI